MCVFEIWRVERAQEEETSIEEQLPTLSRDQLRRHERQTSTDSVLRPPPEFSFVDSPTNLSDGGAETPTALVNRTGEWLSGLNLGFGTDSPTNGLIYQLSDDMPIPSEIDEPESDIDEVLDTEATLHQNFELMQQFAEQESLSTASQALERATDGSDVLSSAELFGHNNLERSTPSEKQLVDERLSLLNSLDPKILEFENPQPTAAKKLNFERRWRRAANSSEDLDQPRRSPSPARPFAPPKMPSPERSISPVNRFEDIQNLDPSLF